MSDLRSTCAPQAETAEATRSALEEIPASNDTLADHALIDRCTAQVTAWLKSAESHERSLPRSIRLRNKRIATVVKDGATAEMTMALTDEVLRVNDTKAAAALFRDVVRSIETTLPIVDRTLLKAGAILAPRLHRLVMPMVIARLRRETSGTIISADPRSLNHHQLRRRSLGFSLNVNRLGEAILGHEEARTRRTGVIEMIGRESTTHVSIKLSAIAANISALDYEATVVRLATELRPIYRAAVEHRVFVNLDMEEYRDLAITVDVFQRVLDEPEFQTLTAGIVLQAYLPDSHQAAQSLGDWAIKRVANGGAPVRIRLVKGANLAMEAVDAELHGWALATYRSKVDVDASWKRLLDTLLDSRLDTAVIVGAASHNLFDVAWALLKRDVLKQRGYADRLRFEMLEGMAESQARAVQASTGDVLMYTPVVDRVDFVPAIGYLTRRLDENTGPENFLRALVDLKVGSVSFVDQVDRFTSAVLRRHSIDTNPFRGLTTREIARHDNSSVGSVNTPDSDVTQVAHRQALRSAVDTYSPAKPHPTVTTIEEVDAVMEAAEAGADRWGRVAHSERARILRSVAVHVGGQRSAIVALLAHEANKVMLEGDSEVSEAIDFANYYATLTDGLAEHDQSAPLGVVVVTPPWNFPYAITMGGVLAALGAGNAVVLKPTPQCPLVAQKVAEDCWDAGIPRHALHLLPVPDDHVGRHLVTHDGVSAVILTGSIQTAQMFLAWKPTMRLLAETSGKNSLLIMASADLDLAIKDLVKSAFGHAGQKCSAASLAIVEASVYDNPDFRRRLADAVKSLTCGLATNPGTDIAPLVESPSSALLRALTTVDPGEAWLVEPRQYDMSDSRCWTPGVRIGVQPGSWFHVTECFGPVLGILRADDLDHAIEIQNATPFGLTAGLHTLDRHEATRWAARVEAGNAYVNRTITGAIVQRQPFGGWKSSSVGPTAKAGGPSYVNILRRWPAGKSPERLASLSTLGASEADPSGLRCETNTLRYRPLPNGIVIWSDRDTDPLQLQLARNASAATGTEAFFVNPTSPAPADAIVFLTARKPDRVRLLAPSPSLRAAAHALGIRVDDDPMSDEPAVEVVRWMREQSISITQHRHGRPHTMPFR